MKHKYKLVWIPTNAVLVLLLITYTGSVFWFGGLPENAETGKPLTETNVQKAAAEIYTHMRHFISPASIYKFCLPFIVIGEGFAAGPMAHVFKIQTVLKVFAKISAIVTCTGIMFHYLSVVAGMYFSADFHVFHNILEAMLFAAFIIPNVYAEGLSALEACPNEKVRSMHLERTYLRNNVALILVATIERYKHSMVLLVGEHNALKTWNLNKFLVSFWWCGLGSIFYGWIVGFIVVKITKKVGEQLDILQISAMILFTAFFLYGTCHLPELGLSGDVAVIIFAFQMRNYGLLNFIGHNAKVVNVVIIFLKEIAEQLAFASLGLFSVVFWISYIPPRLYAYVFIMMVGSVIVMLAFALGSYWWHSMVNGEDERNVDKVTIWEELYLISAQMIKGDLSYALFGSTIMEEWNLVLAVLIYIYILLSYLVWTPLHYLIGRYVLLKDTEEHSGHAERLKKLNEYDISEDGTMSIDIKDPKITSFLRHMLWYPMFVRNFTHGDEHIAHMAHEIHEEIEKVEGEISESGGSSLGSGSVSGHLSVGENENDRLNRPEGVELVGVEVDIDDNRL